MKGLRSQCLEFARAPEARMTMSGRRTVSTPASAARCCPRSNVCLVTRICGFLRLIFFIRIE